MRRVRTLAAIANGVLAWTAFAIGSAIFWDGSILMLTVNTTAMAVFSAFAAVCTARAAVRTGAVQWGAIAAGLTGWLAGNLVCLYYLIGRGANPPFPSIADIGFLALPVCVVVSALLDRRAHTSMTLLRVLDAVTVAAALFLVFWAVAPPGLLNANDRGTLSTAVALAYPIADVVLLTMMILALASAPPDQRGTFALVGGGIATMALADIVWICVSTPPTMSNSTAPSIGWSAGLLMVSAGAMLATRGPTTRPPRHRTSILLACLPYLPLVLAAVVGLAALWPTPGARPILCAGALLMLCALARQLTVRVDHERLLRMLAEQARRDPLTGIGNRALFTDRLNRAMRANRHDGRPVSVLLLDLNDFKLVNDTFGHPTGDLLLVAVAKRLVASVDFRHTVARLGGDEFAIVIDADTSAADAVARAVTAAFAEPFHLDGHELRISPSLGSAAADGVLSAGEILRQADDALYAAKRAQSAARPTDQARTAEP